MKKLLACLMLFFPLQQFAQNYIGTSDNEIYRLNPDYSMTYLCTLDATSGLLDLAVSPSGQLLATLGGSVVSIDTATGTTALVATGAFSVGLVCSNDNIIYFVQTDDDNVTVTHTLRKYDLTSQTFETLVQIPEYIPGDLTLYKGNVLFEVATSPQYNLMAYNLTTHTLTNALCIENPQHAFYGLINTFNQCDENVLLGSGSINSVTNMAKLFEIDLDNQTITEVATTDLAINGMASSTEHLASACASYNFVNDDCATMGTNENENVFFKIYPNPATDVVHLQSPQSIQQITVFDANGRQLLQAKNANAINIANLQQGMYLMQLKTANGIHHSKIIKQ